jgi:hypothetical protein
LVKAARIDPAKAILAAASVPVGHNAYQALWTYQSMFDILLKAKP